MYFNFEEVEEEDIKDKFPFHVSGIEEVQIERYVTKEIQLVPTLRYMRTFCIYSLPFLTIATGITAFFIKIGKD